MAEFTTPGSFLRSRLWILVGVGVLTAGQGIATVATTAEQWAGHWPSSSAAVGSATLWGACLAAGATAWVVAAPRRYGYEGRLLASSRSQLQLYLPGLLSVAAGSLLGYAAVLSYVIWLTAPRATHGSLDVSELLPTLASIPMAVGLGAVLGRVTPALIAPLAGAIAPILVTMWGTYSNGYIDSRLFEALLVHDHMARDYLRLPVELLLSKSLFWIALGAALVSWTLYANRIAYVSAFVAGFALAGAFFTAGIRIDVPPAYAALCLEGKPRVCVDRAHDHVAEEYRDIVTSSLAKLPGLDLSTITVVQGEDLFPNSMRFTGSVPDIGQTQQLVVRAGKRNTAPAHQLDRANVVAQLGFTLFYRPCVTQPTGADGPMRSSGGHRSAMMLYDWWLTINELPKDGSNFLGEMAIPLLHAEFPGLVTNGRRFASLPADERAAWFGDQWDDVLACQAVEPW